MLQPHEGTCSFYFLSIRRFSNIFLFLDHRFCRNFIKQSKTLCRKTDEGDELNDQIQAAQQPYLAMVDQAKDQVAQYSRNSQEMFAASQQESAEANKACQEASYKESQGWHSSIPASLRRVCAMHVDKAKKYQEAAKKMYWAAYKVNQLVSVYEASATQAVEAVRAQEA